MLDALRFITCGSVDDGKSTLIGRLLYESKQIFEDHYQELEKASGKYGTQGKELDLALLVDGLQAEREQGITIDVAYRFFSTENRKFIVADTPGHEQYTRNMATGASTADLAVLLIDARKGLLTQTKRHSRIVSMLGVRHIVVAVNKMDMIGWDEAAFNAIVTDIRALVENFGFASVQAIPMSALTGDNVAFHCEQTPWYTGPSLLEYLESVDVSKPEAIQPFRMPVQYVNRPNSEFRGYCGCVASGSINVGDSIRVVPGGAEAKVKSVVIWQGEQPTANTGDAVTITLDREVDVSRGQVLSSVDDPIEISDQFEASVLCLSEHHLVPGRPYLIKLHTAQVGVTISNIKFKLDINQGSHLAASTLELNDIGEVTLYTNLPVAFESYKQCKTLGAFILIDRMTNETVAAGMINFALRRASNVHWQSVEINKAARATLKSQKPACIWFTGLSGSGKSTIANLLEKRLFVAGQHTYLLDGDNVRHGLNRDLGFTEADRVENIRRVAEVAKLMVDAGLIVIVSFISPFRAEREYARSLFQEGEFVEVFVDTPLTECEARDVKGLYAKARQGKIANFTGLSSPYERPDSPEIQLNTLNCSPDQCVQTILSEVIKQQ
ncbi:MAG: sulfate adenylyltransferase subunit CysN [Gallionella sp.]|nr:sulfate adenylyltransferase subunit CysN [Gallionella sp.]